MIREKIGDADQKERLNLSNREQHRNVECLILRVKEVFGKEIEKIERILPSQAKMDDEKRGNTPGEIEKKALLARDAREALNSTYKSSPEK